VAPSGAPKAWAESDIADATQVIAEDPMISSVMDSFANIYGPSESKRATVTTLQDAINDMMAAIKDLPTTKTLDKSYTLSGQALGDYFTAKTLVTSLKTNIETTDGKALDTEEMSNFLSGSGKFSLNADISAVKDKIPAKSSVKDVKIKTNLAAAASVGSYVNKYDEREPNNLSFSYAASASFAASYNDGKVGGKIIISVTATKPETVIADLDNEDDDTDMTAQFEPKTMAIDITAYNDAGTTVLSKHFTSLEAFQAYVNQ
jgi:hypothetical protein